MFCNLTYAWNLVSTDITIHRDYVSDVEAIAKSARSIIFVIYVINLSSYLVINAPNNVRIRDIILI